MGRRSNYADKQTDDEILDTPELPLRINPPRRYDPSGGAAADNGPNLSLLTEASSGDWSWHPQRSSKDTPTYRPKLHPRACPRCLLTSCLSLITHTVTVCA